TLSWMKNAQYIGHPYLRVGGQHVTKPAAERTVSISTARVHNSKRTQLIIQANALLPVRKRVKILGAEFRLYSYGLMKRYPDLFKQSGHVLNWPLSFQAPVKLCEDAKFNVDFTKFPGDG